MAVFSWAWQGQRTASQQIGFSRLFLWGLYAKIKKSLALLFTAALKAWWNCHGAFQALSQSSLSALWADYGVEGMPFSSILKSAPDLVALPECFRNWWGYLTPPQRPLNPLSVSESEPIFFWAILNVGNKEGARTLWNQEWDQLPSYIRKVTRFIDHGMPPKASSGRWDTPDSAKNIEKKTQYKTI